MKKQLVALSRGAFSNGTVSTALSYMPLLSTNLYFSATEILSETVYNTNGIWEELNVSVPSNTRNGITTVRSRKNNAFGTIIVTIPASTTGVFKDTTNKDRFVSGDKLNYEVSRGGTTGTITFGSVSSIVYTEKNIDKYGSAGSAAFTFGGAASTSQGDIHTGTNINHRYTANDPVIVRNLSVTVSANTLNGSTICSINENLSPSSVTISIPASATGRFMNTSNYFARNIGEKWWFYTDRFASGSGSITINQFAHDICYENQTSYVYYFTGAQIATLQTTDRVLPVIGGIRGDQTVESAVSVEIYERCIAKQIMIGVVTNTSANDQTYTLRVDGANSILNVVVPAGLTGTFTSSTNLVTLNPTNRINYRMTRTGSTGSIVCRMISLLTTNEMSNPEIQNL